jgi:hypothetical protein
MTKSTSEENSIPLLREINLKEHPLNHRSSHKCEDGGTEIQLAIHLSDEPYLHLQFFLILGWKKYSMAVTRLFISI